MKAGRVGPSPYAGWAIPSSCSTTRRTGPGHRGAAPTGSPRGRGPVVCASRVFWGKPGSGWPCSILNWALRRESAAAGLCGRSDVVKIACTRRISAVSRQGVIEHGLRPYSSRPENHKR
jgi:hypothetical protein